MHKKNSMRIKAAAISTAVLAAALVSPFGISPLSNIDFPDNTMTANAADTITIDDLPEDYQYAADWIWENRIVYENSTGRWNTIFDQIIAGEGSINYVVRWHSYESITLEQRQNLETAVSDCLNAWNDWLAGYENWPYQHIDVNIVGWAVIDESSIIDPQADEIIYTNLTDYDASADTPKEGYTIPDKLPNAPDELSRFYHFEQSLYDPTFDAFNYPGGLDKRFDQYLWATEGFPDYGGCDGDWGQRLSDTYYLGIAEGTSSQHVQIHEVGHGFGLTDFYGGEGEVGGYPPGGFPTENGGSIMMAGSSAEITDFDGWMLRYVWTQIKDEEGRFDIEEVVETTTTTTTTTTTSTTPAEITTTTTTAPADTSKVTAEFTEDENGNWNIDAAGADYVELTFDTTAYAGANGVLGYWDNTETDTSLAWKTTAWEGSADADGKLTVTVAIPEEWGDSVQIQCNWAGIWNSETNATETVDIDLANVNLIYGAGSVTTTTTTTVTTPESGTVEAEVTLLEEGYWVFNANGADSADIYLSAPAAAGAKGALAYWDNAWLQPSWEGTFDENGELVLSVSFESEVGDVQVHKYWAQAWDNASQAMADCDVTVAKVILHYGDEETETTTTTTTTTDSETTTTTTTSDLLTTTTTTEASLTTTSSTIAASETTTTTTTANTLPTTTSTSESETTTTVPSNLLIGDANSNGEIEVADAVFILQGIADPSNTEYDFEEYGKLQADADGSGSVDAQDALTIQMYKADMIPSLPYQQ